MITLRELHRMAEQQNIAVDYFPMKKREALSIMDADGNCAIAIDPRKLNSVSDERCKLGHELGHCCSGAFYNEYSDFDCRQKQENKADKWFIKKAIPVDALDDGVAAGYTEIWQLAEYFDVSEDLMRKAVCYYTHGNLASELYF